MKYKEKYVLGEGFPWAYGLECRMLALNERAVGLNPIKLKFPRELWNEDVPKYRLVLEKLNED